MLAPSHPRECPICLEPFATHFATGTVRPCNHRYHETCILQWLAHSNSCPTCRNLYYKVDISDPARPLRTVAVQDKLVDVNAEHIPDEFIITPLDFSERPLNDDDPYPEASGVCSVCSSAAYLRRARPMVGCVGCGGRFHVACLRPVGDAWFCPICDVFQELDVGHRRPAANTAPRAARSSLPRAAPALRRTAQQIIDAAARDFDDRVYVRQTTLNGGVLRRREARAQQNLTPEERRSWELFEAARGGANDVEEQIPIGGVERKRRRRRREPVLDADASLQLSAPQGAFKQETSSNSELGQPGDGPNADTPAHILERGLATDLAETESESSGIGLGSEQRGRHLPQDEPPTRLSRLLGQIRSGRGSSPANSPTELVDLTLDQKTRVQRHVRDHLRPIYQPLQPPAPGIIVSEKQFIDCNRSISRMAYAAILADSERESILDDDAKLRDLVTRCVRSYVY